MSSHVEAVFAAANQQELAEQYDKWAVTYEDDLIDQGGPKEAVELLARYVQPTARILDAGCGTGVVGKLLADLGYVTVEGLDLSAGMLGEARNKGCYVALHQMALGEPLEFDTGRFDAVILVGVFARGHAPSRSFDEVIRSTKPGGYIIFTLRPEFYENTDFKAAMNSLAETGRWRLAEVSEPFDGRFKAHPEVRLQVWVFQVL